MAEPIYRRVVVKVSGEALMGPGDFGIHQPTLERIAMWLWDRLHNRLPGLAEIEIARDSCHEGCIYRGPRPRLAAE